jgi:hypothetical protein
MLGAYPMAVRGMGVVPCLLVLVLAVMLGRLAVMLRGLFVMLGCGFVVVGGRMRLRHDVSLGSLPVGACAQPVGRDLERSATRATIKTE